MTQMTYMRQHLHDEVNLLAHLSRRLTGELVVYPCPSSVRRPSFTILKIFSSETARPIVLEPPYGGGTKIYINDLGHMIKMAAMVINSKSTVN